MEFPSEEARREYFKEHPKADPKKHTVKQKREKGTLLSEWRKRVENKTSLQMYEDVAVSVSPEKWREYMKSFELSPDQADQLKAEITRGQKEKERERSKKEWEKEKSLAFKGALHAGEELQVKPAAKSPVETSKGLEPIGKLLGGLAKKFPVVQGLIDAKLIKGIVSTDKSETRGTADYNSKLKKIQVREPEYANEMVLLHEIGHALEEKAPEGWMHKDGWGFDQPAASMYPAGNHSEQFAEAFVELLTGDAKGFHKHAPEQAKLVSELMRSVSKKANMTTAVSVVRRYEEQQKTAKEVVWNLVSFAARNMPGHAKDLLKATNAKDTGKAYKSLETLCDLMSEASRGLGRTPAVTKKLEQLTKDFSQAAYSTKVWGVIKRDTLFTPAGSEWPGSFIEVEGASPSILNQIAREVGDLLPKGWDADAQPGGLEIHPDWFIVDPDKQFSAEEFSDWDKRRHQKTVKMVEGLLGQP